MKTKRSQDMRLASFRATIASGIIQSEARGLWPELPNMSTLSLRQKPENCRGGWRLWVMEMDGWRICSIHTRVHMQMDGLAVLSHLPSVDWWCPPTRRWLSCRPWVQILTSSGNTFTDTLGNRFDQLSGHSLPCQADTELPSQWKGIQTGGVRSFVLCSLPSLFLPSVISTCHTLNPRTFNYEFVLVFNVSQIYSPAMWQMP